MTKSVPFYYLFPFLLFLWIAVRENLYYFLPVLIGWPVQYPAHSASAYTIWYEEMWPSGTGMGGIGLKCAEIPDGISANISPLIFLAILHRIWYSFLQGVYRRLYRLLITFPMQFMHRIFYLTGTATAPGSHGVQPEFSVHEHKMLYQYISSGSRLTARLCFAILWIK